MPRTLPRWLDGAAVYFRIIRLRPEFVERREEPVTVCYAKQARLERPTRQIGLLKAKEGGRLTRLRPYT
jgi:hypothetical protein